MCKLTSKPIEISVLYFQYNFSLLICLTLCVMHIVPKELHRKAGKCKEKEKRVSHSSSEQLKVTRKEQTH